LWQRYYNWPNSSSDELLVAPGDAPLLVLQLADWQLKSLQEEAYPGSLASEEGAAEETWPSETECVVVVDGRPSRIPISELLLPSPTPSPRRLPKTSSSSESGQVRNPNGTFGANQGG